MRAIVDPEPHGNADFGLDRNAWGQLVLSLPDGRRIEGVDVVRAFPNLGARRVCLDLRRPGP